jgi:TetR/AcrR family transcriptional regulator, cholesterol catabolism regulator
MKRGQSEGEQAGAPATAQVADQRTRLGDIALDLFLERGYDATPMSVIAKRAGLTKAGIYHHFESKDELLYFVHKRHIEGLLLPMLEAVASEADSEKRIEKFIREYALLLTRYPFLRVLINETKQLSPEREQEIRNAWRTGLHLVRDAIVEMQQKGRCSSKINPTYAAFAAIGMCSWICNWFDATRRETGDVVAQTMVRIFLRGILR